MPAHPTRITVLIVEDDELLRSTLADILELEGFNVLQANDGRTGLEMAFARIPAVVVTDVAMPVMDGYELLRCLRADERTRMIPVIMMSALVEPHRIAQGMTAGAVE
jgi:CheY-like chemotaxis protein